GGWVRVVGRGWGGSWGGIRILRWVVVGILGLCRMSMSLCLLPGLLGGGLAGGIVASLLRLWFLRISGHNRRWMRRVWLAGKCLVSRFLVLGIVSRWLVLAGLMLGFMLRLLMGCRERLLMVWAGWLTGWRCAGVTLKRLWLPGLALCFCRRLWLIVGFRVGGLGLPILGGMGRLVKPSWEGEGLGRFFLLVLILA
ncbi:hypothetical protein FB33_2659, partial [Cutibacterium acnes]